ncbi:MAG: Hpt domain-containing protein [Desulfobacteraceae bacterium]|nr:Hpt domain-containing protein [Desulfobacteraceae bacterium]
MPNQMEDAKSRIKPIVEDVAEQFVMADLSEPSVAKDLSEAFSGIAGELEPHFSRCALAAKNAGRVFHQKGCNGSEIDEEKRLSVEQTISALQSLVYQDAAEEELDLPREFLPEEQQEMVESQESRSKHPASAVDGEILGEYLAQQEAVISEIEDLVLSLEQQADSQVLKELKRLLHTAKGEAGVIGLNRIEKVCHQVEDYIQRHEEHLEADLLLEFKDWFEQAVTALKNSTAGPSEQDLLHALADEGPKEAGREPEKAEKPETQPAEKPDEQSDKQQGSPRQGSDEACDELLSPVAIDDPEITADFISEANEHFEISDENLLTLENDPENEEAVASIFRAFHTIKGTTSFLGLTPISVLAHKAENLLDEVRKKRLDFNGEVVDATFNALDLLKKMNKDLESVLAVGEMFVPPQELAGVFAQLQRALSGESSSAPVKAPGEPEEPEVSAGRDSTADTAAESREAQAGAAPEPEPAASAQAANGSGGYAGKAVKQTMKIDADRIDLLLETIGELVIVESIVGQEAGVNQAQGRDLERNLGQLKKITRSLQDIGMSMRLIPIDNTFRKMGRLVRDLSKKSGKKIELVMEGRETELDKGMVEKLGDPLVHMIRNAVDHGIENTAEERSAAGKNPTGTILLKAYHQGGNIHIDIQDDGRGLDRDAIAAKALERDIISNTENMTDEEIYALIFEPGFSTAKQITDVSGRGVGMDVVKSNIESMRGNVRISSQKGVGSTFTLVLPLTMAIIDGMIVRVGPERYILPLLSIIESFQPTSEMITTVSGKGETVPFRNRLLPLFRLAHLFGIPDAQMDPTQALVVVVEDAGRQVAVLVDELLGQNQTVIKNLGQGLKDVEGIAGASIMPDGTPGLIIDVNGLVKLATA